MNPTTMGNYDTAIAGLIDHTEDTEVHVQPGERAAWDAGAEAAEQAEADAAEALSAIAGLESRVSRVEDGLFNNITGNPFLVQFDSLDGVVMKKGIWNCLLYTSQLSLDDKEGVWLGSWLNTPSASKGAEISAVIVQKNWESDGKDRVLDCGVFAVDTVDGSGPPAKATIKAGRCV